MRPQVLILGCGFTGRQVAKQLLARGTDVTATTRSPQALSGLGVRAITLDDLDRHLIPNLLVVHSIPPDGPPDLIARLRSAPSRLVYLSSTAVYGEATDVDNGTPVDPAPPRARIRLEAEAAAAHGPWTSLILRPAAIYGPGRGAHISLRRGTYSAGPNYVSRIHVEDLAAHVVAALFSPITGAFPVADEEPCTSYEIAAFCADLLRLPLPEGVRPSRPLTDRRVDGSAIRRLLGVTLRYPSYRVGIPAALAAEQPHSV